MLTISSELPVWLAITLGRKDPKAASPVWYVKGFCEKRDARSAWSLFKKALAVIQGLPQDIAQLLHTPRQAYCSRSAKCCTSVVPCKDSEESKVSRWERDSRCALLELMSEEMLRELDEVRREAWERLWSNDAPPFSSV
jgi:hypothetical protein